LSGAPELKNGKAQCVILYRLITDYKINRSIHTSIIMPTKGLNFGSFQWDNIR